MPARRLLDEGFELTAWFRNPNIQPLAEYLRRREAAAQCAERLGIDMIFEDEWNLADWLEKQLPRRESPGRCHFCCGERLEAAARAARKLGFPNFSSSLLYSRYQPHDFMAAKGAAIAAEGAPRFIYRDFRKDWQAGIDASLAWGLYRQPYCGCLFSEAERYAKKFARAKASSNFPQNIS